MNVSAVMIWLSVVSVGTYQTLVCPENEQPAACKSGQACPIIRIPPVFPIECVRDGTSKETVTLRAIIVPDGRVKSAEVLKSTNGCLNEAALTNMCRARFEPFEEKGKMGDRIIVQEMKFEIAE